MAINNASNVTIVEIIAINKRLYHIMAPSWIVYWHMEYLWRNK